MASEKITYEFPWRILAPLVVGVNIVGLRRESKLGQSNATPMLAESPLLKRRNTESILITYLWPPKRSFLPWCECACRYIRLCFSFESFEMLSVSFSLSRERDLSFKTWLESLGSKVFGSAFNDAIDPWSTDGESILIDPKFVFTKLKNSLLSRNFTNFPRFPLFSSLQVFVKKVRFMVYSSFRSFFFIIYLFFFFFLTRINLLSEQTTCKFEIHFLLLTNPKFAGSVWYLSLTRLRVPENGCNAMNSRFSDSFALESLRLYTNSRIFRFRRWKYRLIFNKRETR